MCCPTCCWPTCSCHCRNDQVAKSPRHYSTQHSTATEEIDRKTDPQNCTPNPPHSSPEQASRKHGNALPPTAPRTPPQRAWRTPGKIRPEPQSQSMRRRPNSEKSPTPQGPGTGPDDKPIGLATSPGLDFGGVMLRHPIVIKKILPTAIIASKVENRASITEKVGGVLCLGCEAAAQSSVTRGSSAVRFARATPIPDPAAAEHTTTILSTPCTSPVTSRLSAKTTSIIDKSVKGPRKSVSPVTQRSPEVRYTAKVLATTPGILKVSTMVISPVVTSQAPSIFPVNVRDSTTRKSFVDASAIVKPPLGGVVPRLCYMEKPVVASLTTPSATIIKSTSSTAQKACADNDAIIRSAPYPRISVVSTAKGSPTVGYTLASASMKSTRQRKSITVEPTICKSPIAVADAMPTIARPSTVKQTITSTVTMASTTVESPSASPATMSYHSTPVISKAPIRVVPPRVSHALVESALSPSTAAPSDIKKSAIMKHITAPKYPQAIKAPPSPQLVQSCSACSLPTVPEMQPLTLAPYQTYNRDRAPKQQVSKQVLVQTTESFRGHLIDFIETMDLCRFYTLNDPYLSELCTKAAALRLDKDTSLTLNRSEDVIDLTKLALYDTIIYCDDSGSMGSGNRIPALKDLVTRVTKIATMLDAIGIKVRFINFDGDNGYNDIRSVNDTERIMSSIDFDGSSTQLGTGLERKILEPLLYHKISTSSLKRPLLIATITDGEPNGESEGYFRDVILRCEKYLISHGFNVNTAVFQVNQVGNDACAENFVRKLHNDAQVGHLVYCTSDKMDQKIRELKDNEQNLERWLLDLLVQGLHPAVRTGVARHYPN